MSDQMLEPDLKSGIQRHLITEGKVKTNQICSKIPMYLASLEVKVILTVWHVIITLLI
jgi:hypothetical protein